MRYTRNTELPKKVLKCLPLSAQETYRRAFNNVWNNYGETEPGTEQDLEAKAHWVAWASVEQNFHKTPRGQWVPD